MTCVAQMVKLDIASLTADRRIADPYVDAGLGFLPLSRGLWAVVDEADFAEASHWKWTAKVYPTKAGALVYAYRQAPGPDGRKRPLKLHRDLLDAPAGLDVDHKNGDGQDCRRINLRLCTRHENNLNRATTTGASQYRGVTWDASRGLWLAQVTIGGKTQTAGRFSDEADAARARDALAVKMHGEFVWLNFPPEAAP